MKLKTLQSIALAMLMAGVAFGQRSSSIRANIRGGGGDGKCTFEVVVDGAADVEIRGAQGILRTLSGNPARWVRLDCNQEMPANPNDFRFRGVDGRGSQQLMREPSGNRGSAVIRIEDPKGGSEGYTGDVTWRGGSGTVGGGNWNGGGGGGGNWGGGVGGGGWNGQSGGTFNFRGDGNGVFNRRNGRDMRVRDVNVNLSRNGSVRLEFEADGFGRRMVFAGRAGQYSRDSVVTDLRGSNGSQGTATIYVDRNGNVDRIDMNGRDGRDDFRLNWRSR